MPGGVYNWSQGEVLDAADLNEFLGNQVIARFTNTAARTAAYGVAHAPALQAGLFAWTADNGKLYYYNGTSWDEVGAQVEDGEIVTAKIADSAVTSAKIADGTIVNADVNASAAIAHTKLAAATAGQVLLGTTTTGVVTATTVSGDVTITGAGVTDISSGVIVDADINASAAIAYSKLSLSGSITTTDLATGAARSGFRSHIVTQQGATHTIAASDVGGLVVLSSCTSVVIPTSDGTFTVGDRIDFLQTGSQVVTFSATAPQTVGGFDSQTKLGGQYAVATLVKYAANTWVLVGNITS